MILLISPAKTLDFNTMPQPKDTAMPRMKDECMNLIKILKKLNSNDLKNLMGISDDLAALNVARYQQFSDTFTPQNAKAAVLAFKGDVYVGFDATNLTPNHLAHAQQHVRILSGLYGLLRPLDLIQPYRLEMGTPLPNAQGKNLYDFWGDRITNLLNHDLAEANAAAVVNLASNEYFKAIRPKQLAAELYQVEFKENKGGTFKVVSFFAKKARGMMCRFVAKNALTKPDELKEFDMEGYTFNQTISSAKTFVFTR